MTILNGQSMSDVVDLAGRQLVAFHFPEIDGQLFELQASWDGLGFEPLHAVGEGNSASSRVWLNPGSSGQYMIVSPYTDWRAVRWIRGQTRSSAVNNLVVPQTADRQIRVIVRPCVVRLSC